MLRLARAVPFLLVSSSVFAESAEVPVLLEPPVVGVPFGCGMSFPVSQVHNIGSHVNNDGWAWDFRMPEGTPVVAALDGVVRLARGDSREGGCDPQLARTANYVVLEHGGGLETQYLHFSSVVVRPGEHVRQGQLLGYSGKTGWACGAHLHFKVAAPVGDGWNNPSVEARIRGYGDPPLESWVSSPPCGTNPLVVAEKGPAQARPSPGSGQPPAQAAGGTVAPASLSTAPGAEEAIRSPRLSAPAGQSQAAASRPLPAQSQPVAHPLSSGAAPLAAVPAVAPASVPLAPAPPSPAGTPGLLQASPRGSPGPTAPAVPMEPEVEAQPAAAEAGAR